ncbi:hypothetical protein vseg_017422 [Gypsophila vaccaria]
MCLLALQLPLYILNFEKVNALQDAGTQPALPCLFKVLYKPYIGLSQTPLHLLANNFSRNKLPLRRISAF